MMMDWQVGDLAVRIDCDPPEGVVGIKSDVRIGDIKHVSQVVSVCGVVGLRFEEGPEPPGVGWVAEQWRKIRPDEHEACEDDFVKLLKRSKQQVEV